METLLRATKGGSGREIIVLHSMNGLMGLGLAGLTLLQKEFMIGAVIRQSRPDSRTAHLQIPAGRPHEGYLAACGITSGHLSCDFDISCHLTKSPRPTSVTCLQPDPGEDGTELWDTRNT